MLVNSQGFHLRDCIRKVSSATRRHEASTAQPWSLTTPELSRSLREWLALPCTLISLTIKRYIILI